MFTTSACYASEEPETIWHAAVYQDEVVGDLQAAILLYEQIIKHSKNRELVSAAMLQASICYERTGDTDKAKKIISQLKDDYIDIPKIAQAFLGNKS